MAYKIDPLDAEHCDCCGTITFAWVNPCTQCQEQATLRAPRAPIRLVIPNEPYRSWNSR